MTPSEMHTTEQLPPATPNEDPTAVSRKQDHIELAFKSQIAATALDERFYYEPILSGHPERGSLKPFSFLGHTLRTPMWVSSMTGGTAMARTINHNLAKACAEFGIGMGLGSCRQLLFSDDHLSDFDVRNTLGPDLPLFANLGIAQLEQLLEQDEMFRLDELVEKLKANGLIIHVNPLQEAMQPEGDVFKKAPLDTIEAVLEKFSGPVIVKEVGQGMGPASLRALLQLPLAAIEFAAAGGTNFAKLELLRSTPGNQLIFEKIANVGHTAPEMIDMANALVDELGAKRKTEHLIISGGVKDFLDGYYLLNKSKMTAVYGQASGFLKHAQGDYKALRTYVQAQVKGLELANAFLRVR